MLGIWGIMNIYQKENKIIGFGIMPALKFPVWAFSVPHVVILDL